MKSYLLVVLAVISVQFVILAGWAQEPDAAPAASPAAQAQPAPALAPAQEAATAGAPGAFAHPCSLSWVMGDLSFPGLEQTKRERLVKAIELKRQGKFTQAFETIEDDIEPEKVSDTEVARAYMKVMMAWLGAEAGTISKVKWAKRYKAMIKRVGELKKGDPESRLAWSVSEMRGGKLFGDPKKAGATFKKMLERYPNWPVVKMFYGEWLEKYGDDPVQGGKIYGEFRALCADQPVYKSYVKPYFDKK